MIEQRNGIGIKALGDKYYKQPEYSDRFFKSAGDGLVVGSGFVRGSYEKTIPLGTVDYEVFMAENPRAARRKSYAELEKERAQAASEADATGLVSWERDNLKEVLGEENFYEPSDSDEEDEKAGGDGDKAEG